MQGVPDTAAAELLLVGRVTCTCKPIIAPTSCTAAYGLAPSPSCWKEPSADFFAN